MKPNPDIRWKQRFRNFDRAFVLLRDAMEKSPAALNQLEREGVIQRFEYCFELAWKTVNELPLPYRFEVQSLDHIHHRPLLEHIKRVGILIYPEK